MPFEIGRKTHTDSLHMIGVNQKEFRDVLYRTHNRYPDKDSNKQEESLFAVAHAFARCFVGNKADTTTTFYNILFPPGGDREELLELLPMFEKIRSYILQIARY